MDGTAPLRSLLCPLVLVLLLARPAAADPAGEALIGAAKAGDLAAVQALLESGAHPDAHDRVDNTALIFAARDGRLEIARALIGRGATVNWIDGEGVTPLILAAFKGHLEIARLLLAHGADAELRDRWGRRALDYALRRGQDDPIAQLLRTGP